MVSRYESWHRRHAVQIAAQLPENAEDALAVLELAKSLVESFWSDSKPPNQAVLVSFPSASSNRRARATESAAGLPK